ncbi:MAG: hypothetical protein KDC61_03040 [Saprospiraceae bacterium]|nr:hypothetical protein [Saprospiraceae bacterium]
MSQNERIKAGKKLIEAIARDAASREEAWQYVTQWWLSELSSNVVEAGWSAQDAERGLAIVILRVHRLLGVRITDEKAYLSSRKHEVIDQLGLDFFKFLKIGILDAVIMKDIQDGDGEKPLSFIKKQWMAGIGNEFIADTAISYKQFEEIFDIALEGLKRRVSQNYIFLKEYPLSSYLFDECLIVMIEGGKINAERAFSYIQNNWLRYLTSAIPRYEGDELCINTFNQVLSNFWKRITLPKKGERLYLKERLKTYLYTCMRNEYPNQKKELQNKEEPPLTYEYHSDSPKYDRWASFSLTNSERWAVVKNLTDGCKELFELDAEGLRDVDIAQRLKIKSADSVKNKRYKCNAKIEAFIQEMRKQRNE